MCAVGTEIDDDDEATLDAGATDSEGVPAEAHASEDKASLSSIGDEFVADAAPVPTPTPTPTSSLPIKFEPVTFDAPDSAPPPKKPTLGKARALSSSG